MDKQQFRDDLCNAVFAYGGPAYKFAKAVGINQTFLRRIMKGERGISLETAIRLWPFVYGADFPHIPDRAPAKSD